MKIEMFWVCDAADDSICFVASSKTEAEKIASVAKDNFEADFYVTEGYFSQVINGKIHSLKNGETETVGSPTVIISAFNRATGNCKVLSTHSNIEEADKALLDLAIQYENEVDWYVDKSGFKAKYCNMEIYAHYSDSHE